MGNIYVNYFKFGQVVHEEMSFKEKVYAQQTMHNGQRPITIAQGELKLVFLSLQIFFVLANSVDHDEMPHFIRVFTVRQATQSTRC